MIYRLSLRAERDIGDIYRKGAALFGMERADSYQNGLRRSFDMLAANPRLARERTELKRLVRLHPYQAHMIVYVEHDNGILIVRVLHARQDWARHLRL